MTRTLVDWLLDRHPFFGELTAHVLHTIDAHRPASLDALVVAARRPVRSVLLALDPLERRGEVAVTDGAIHPADPGLVPFRVSRRPDCIEPVNPAVSRTYLELARERETPALLWTQRRLVPDSALERCDYIRRWAPRRRVRVLFLGDDDLVSPVLSALEPHWEVQVVDIDAEVLNTVTRVASALGAKVECLHEDLAVTAARSESFDVVVCDPFPSGDGEFEAFFWSRACAMLRRGGVLISTISPSHKPVGYELNALRVLGRLELAVVDLQADFGRYETFEFELTEHERAILRRLGLESGISQTKSLFAAVATRDQPPALTDFDFGSLVRGMSRHYLTVQAGRSGQEELARARGVAGDEGAADPEQGGLRIDLLVPEPGAAARSTPEQLDALRATMAADGYALTERERHELERLAHDAELPGTDLAEVGLAVRAIESWTRWSISAP